MSAPTIASCRDCGTYWVVVEAEEMPMDAFDYVKRLQETSQCPGCGSRQTSLDQSAAAMDWYRTAR